MDFVPASLSTLESISRLLQGDDKVKLAGIDADGMLRGKVISKRKFLSVAKSGFGFCSVIFGWDMHDRTYFRELAVSNAENGYRDLLAGIDLASFRRIPWELDAASGKGIPFFLVSFFDPATRLPVAPCPRGLLASVAAKLDGPGWSALAGAEYEFYNFRETPKSLDASGGQGLAHLTPGMFGYSVTRPIQNQEFFYGKKFKVDIEGWHTESGPGVYEAALEYGPIANMADRASLFKYVVKALGTAHGITPCFMAKPAEGLPGNSGHMHVSLVNKSTGVNLFAYDGDRGMGEAARNPNAQHPDLAYVSDLGHHFLAGILAGLPSIMPVLAPTINSYKRLVENFWAPVTVSWGLEHRAASIRVIAPPTAPPAATRFEVRTCGADANPHYVLAAILGCGLRGIDKKLPLNVPPLGKGQGGGQSGESGGGCGGAGAGAGAGASTGERLAKNLGEAVACMVEPGSVAREVLGDSFVDHFAGTRLHEVHLWEQAVTDWEVRRYIETV